MSRTTTNNNTTTTSGTNATATQTRQHRNNNNNISSDSQHHLNECDEDVKLSIDVPGVRARDLVVEVDDGVLRISGTRRIGVCRNSGMAFEQSFRMDQTTIDTSRVTANLSAGVLVVTVPKRAKQERQVLSVTEEPHDYEEETRVEGSDGECLGGSSSSGGGGGDC